MKTTARYGKKADLALSMWVKLNRASATFGKKALEHIQSTGLTQAQFGALECLGHLGKMTMCELSRKMLVTSGNTTVVIDNLEKQGLVERIPSRQDRRAIMISLTSKGKKLFEEIFPRHAEYVAGLASVLTSREQETLGELLKKLGRGIQESE